MQFCDFSMNSKDLVTLLDARKHYQYLQYEVNPNDQIPKNDPNPIFDPLDHSKTHLGLSKYGISFSFLCLGFL